MVQARQKIKVTFLKTYSGEFKFLNIISIVETVCMCSSGVGGCIGKKSSRQSSAVEAEFELVSEPERVRATWQ